MGNDPTIEAIAEARATFRRLHLGRWGDARPRLLARLVPRTRAGPLRRHPARWPPDRPGHLGSSRSAIVADVGIDLPAGIARVDRGLLDAWGVDPPTIWRAARANLDRRAPAAAAVLLEGTTRLRITVGDPWTTGLILQPDRLGRLGLGEAGFGEAGLGGPETPERARVPAAGPFLAVAPHPGLLVIADHIGPGEPGDALAQMAPRLLALVGGLLTIDDQPRLPPDVLLVVDEGPFLPRWILE